MHKSFLSRRVAEDLKPAGAHQSKVVGPFKVRREALCCQILERVEELNSQDEWADEE